MSHHKKSPANHAVQMVVMGVRGEGGNREVWREAEGVGRGVNYLR